jgi:AcrR family transcriptional regulator
MIATHHRKRLGAAARRESILAAAMPEFATSGYDRTRVSDIAARVGVTEPVVFQNFGTKPALFVAVLDRMSEEVARHLSELGDHSPDVVHLLSVLLSHELQDRLHSSGGLGMIFAEAGGNPEPSIRAAGRRAHERTLQAIAGLLSRGQAEGSIRADVEAMALAWLVISQIHARQFRRAHSDTSPTLEHAMLDALLAALRPPGRALTESNVAEP